MDCECKNWGSEDLRLVILTGHHEQCPKRPDPMTCLFSLVKELVKGMEKWSADEDGIHSGAWDAYRKAKDVLLEPVKGETP